jgi:uncharacterized protein YbjT (DUF2867 family)
MSLVLVTGGTGHLGKDLVDHLVRSGHQVRLYARSRRQRSDVEWATGDLATGEGLPTALRGVHTVINAATHSPVAQRGGFRPVDFFRSPSDVDAEGTQRLLDLPQQASVQHFLHVSIVGLDEASLPYARVKLAGERMVRQSALSWSLVRAMPFIICSNACSPVLPGFRFGRCRGRCAIRSIHPMLPTISCTAPSTAGAASGRRSAVPRMQALSN